MVPSSPELPAPTLRLVEEPTESALPAEPPAAVPAPPPRRVADTPPPEPTPASPAEPPAAASATPRPPVMDAPPREPVPTPSLRRSASDPFAPFIDDGSPAGRTPLAPLREATAGPAIDPFASRIVGDTRPPAAPAPARVFSDPLAARIDPLARVVPPPAEPDREPPARPPRFLRRVEAVTVAMGGPAGNGARALPETVRQARRERQSGDPGYMLADVVRRVPRRTQHGRPRVRPAHRNLLTSLLH